MLDDDFVYAAVHCLEGIRQFRDHTVRYASFNLQVFKVLTTYFSYYA